MLHVLYFFVQSERTFSSQDVAKGMLITVAAAAIAASVTAAIISSASASIVRSGVESYRHAVLQGVSPRCLVRLLQFRMLCHVVVVRFTAFRRPPGDAAGARRLAKSIHSDKPGRIRSHI